MVRPYVRYSDIMIVFSCTVLLTTIIYISAMMGLHHEHRVYARETGQQTGLVQVVVFWLMMLGVSVLVSLTLVCVILCCCHLEKFVETTKNFYTNIVVGTWLRRFRDNCTYVRKLFGRTDVTVNDEEQCLIVRDEYLNSSEDGSEPRPTSPRRRRVKFVVECAMAARNKFPLFKRSQANRIVVRKFIYDMMVARNMRASHIQAQLDYAVNLAFVENEGERDVRVMEATRSYESFTRTPKLVKPSWWNPLGSVRKPIGWTTD